MIPFWRKKHQEKEAFVLKNGGILLEQLITTFNGKRNPIRNFSSKELKLATNNYDSMNVIMDAYCYKLYKGFPLDGQISVMVFNSKSCRTYDEWINNIVFASQMCHKHILKLIGCCLETEVPILVFESLVKYGTLEGHIHNHHESHLEPLSWRQRLKIAMEISHTFAYLHVGFPRPIVYSQMRSSLFLLDEHFVPKLFDFSVAQCIPEGETQIKAAPIRGTVGYVPPEFLEGVLDEKSDVYGFGTLLLELLTGKGIFEIFGIFTSKIVSSKTEDEDLQYSSGTEDEDSGTQYHDRLQNFVKKINEDNRLIEAVDPIIVGDGQSASETVSSKTEDEDLQYSSGTDDEHSGTQDHDWWQNFVKKINEDNRFIEAVDPIIVGDGLCPEIEQQLKVCRELAVKCLSYSGEDRPTMIDVAKQLRQLYLSTS